MTIESRGPGRLLAGALIILGAVAVALLLRAGDSPPQAVGGPVAVPSEAASPATTPMGGATAERETLERSYELTAGETFRLDVDRGDVEVLPGDGPGARLLVELVGGSRPPARFEWTTTRDEHGTRVVIRSQSSRSWFSRLFGGDEPEEEVVLIEGERVKTTGKRARVGRVLLELPPDSPLELRSGAGDLSVADRQAPVNADSGAGDVQLSRIAADVDVDTGAGSISLDAIAGDARADSGAGDVEARGVLGALDVDTGAGSVRFAGAPTSVNVDTGAGGIEGELSALTGAVTLSTGMGGIRLHLPPGVDAELVADSGLGSVEARIEGARLGARRDEELKATLGAGGPPIRLNTGTGSIRVDDQAGAGAN